MPLPPEVDADEVLALLSEQALLGIALVQGGRLAYINREYASIIGYTVDEMLALGPGEMFKHIHPEDRNFVMEQVAKKQRLGATKVTEHYRHRVIDRAGGLKHVEIHSRAVAFAGGAADLVVARDVTEEVEAEAARATAREEARRQQRLADLGRLASGIAHDFNNLLTIVLAGADQVSMSPGLGAEDATILESVALAAEQAARLTQQLLFYGRGSRTAPQLIDPKTELSGIVSLLQRSTPRGIELEVAIESGAVRMPPSHLEQVVMNLVANAIAAQPDRGRVAVRGVVVEEAYQVEVEDAGPGIPDEVAPRLFDPFFTTKGSSGTGLGLAIVARVVEEAQGKVSFESAPGRTVFRVAIPTADHATPAPRRRVERPGVAEMPAVLIVDGDPGVRAMIATAMERSGAAVMSVATGQEALALLHDDAFKVEVLVCDAVLRDQDAATLIGEARRLRPGLPALVLSGDVSPDAGGPGARLDKPFTVRELTERVLVLRQGA